MPFKRRPRFIFQNQGGAITNLVCDPRPYVRARRADGRTLWAPCLAWAAGPQELAVTGDGSYTTLFGRDWLLQMCDDGSWVLYQTTEDGALEVIPWDTTPPMASATGRHPTLAFDQVARPAMAWEDSTGILLREYDELSGSYYFVGPFDGCDPVLINDSIVNYHVAGSDVVLFYLNTARDTLMYRVQNENFAIEHVHYEYGTTGIVLDAPQFAGYRFQLKYSNGYGSPIDEGSSFRVLMSDVYPIHVQENMIANISAFEDGEIQNVVLKRPEVIEEIEGVVGIFEDGEYVYVIILRDESVDELEGIVGVFGDGEFIYVIIQRDEVVEEIEATVAVFGDGELKSIIIQRSEIVDSMVATVGSFGDGVYAAA